MPILSSDKHTQRENERRQCIVVVVLEGVTLFVVVFFDNVALGIKVSN